MTTPRWQTPISRWEFEGNADDKYGLRDGIEVGTVVYSSDSKDKGLALTCDGGADYIALPLTKLFTYTNFSISGWFKRVAGQYLFVYTETSTASNNPLICLYHDTVAENLIYYVRNDASTFLFTGTHSITDYLWHHVVITDANGTVISYIDGAPGNISGSYARATLSTTNASIGATIRTGNTYGGGYIDDVRLYDVALTADEVLALYRSYDTPKWDQPLHRWKLDGDATDSAGSKDGTAVGTVEYTAASKVSGNYSGVFNGSSSYISVPVINSSAYTNFSLSLWFYASATQPELGPGLYCSASSSTDNSFWKLDYLYSNSGTLRFACANDAGTLLLNVATTKTYNDDKWHNVVIIDANGVVTSYIDSIAGEISGSYTRVALSQNITTIGSDKRSSVNRIFSGKIDDVRFYDTALTAAEVKALYNSYFTDKAISFMGSMI